MIRMLSAFAFLASVAGTACAADKVALTCSGPV